MRTGPDCCTPKAAERTWPLLAAAVVIALALPALPAVAGNGEDSPRGQVEERVAEPQPSGPSAKEVALVRQHLNQGSLDRARSALFELAERFPDHPKVAALEKRWLEARHKEDARLLDLARAEGKKGRFTEALHSLHAISTGFEKRDAVKSLIADYEVKELRAIAKAQREQYRQLFKAMKGHNEIALDGITYTRRKVTTGSTWYFDKAGKAKEKLSAGGGNSFVVAEFDVASPEKEPILHPIAAYYVNHDRAFLLGGFTTAFRQWSDYEAYLGNREDTANEFGRKSQVKLTSSLVVSRGIIKKYALFVVIAKRPCLYRQTRGDASPPVYFESRNCTLSAELAPEEMEIEFEILAILNPDKL